MNSLQSQDLSVTVCAIMIERLAERARRRVREELDRLGVTQRDICGQLKWSQAKVAQKLTGRTPWTLDELDSLCFIAGIPATEAVRDRGLEFCAEMTPSEMRLLEVWRKMSQADRDAYFQIMTGKATGGKTEQRRALPSKIVKKRQSVR